MHVTLRRYTRLGAPRQQIVEAVDRGLVPLLKRQDGFRGYCAFWSEENHAVSASLFEDQGTAEKANAQAREWVQQNASLLPEPPEAFSGPCRFHALANSREQYGTGRPLYVMVQRFVGMPPLDQTRPISGEVLLPAITEAPGFRGVYMVRNEREPDRSAVVMLFDGKGDAERCHRRLINLMRQHMPKALPEPLIAGQTAILVVGG